MSDRTQQNTFEVLEGGDIPHEDPMGKNEDLSDIELKESSSIRWRNKWIFKYLVENFYNQIIKHKKL